MKWSKEYRTRRGFLVSKPMVERLPEVKKKSSAYKEDVIVNTILDRDSQLNLLATIVLQLGELAGLDTPEFTHAKAKFAEIKLALQ